MRLKILFLTNNPISKPIELWLRKKYIVKVYTKKLSKKMLLRIRPDYIISYNYRYIILKDLLDLYKDRFINLHISYLPYNRGAYPNIFSFLDYTPKGVTIHYIDEGIDSGDIIAQKKVALSDEQTLKSSYKFLHFHIRLLFKSIFPKLKKIKSKKNNIKSGTLHYIKDIENIVFPDSYDISIKRLKELNDFKR